MDPTVTVALIALTSALAGSVIGTFFGPWVKWRYTNRQEMRVDQKARVAEWRHGIALIREAEKNQPVEVTDTIEMMSRSFGDVRPLPKKLVYPDPDTADATTKSWFVTLSHYLSDKERGRVFEFNTQRLDQRRHAVSDLLAVEVARIERDVWKLL